MQMKFANEKNCIIALAILFTIISAYVQSFPHDIKEGTIPDERAFYQWTMLYMEGKYVIPIEDLKGHYTDEIKFVAAQEQMIFVDVELLDMNGTGVKDDVLVKVYDSDGNGVYNATVELNTMKGFLRTVTDYDGTAVLYNVPLEPVQRITVYYSLPNKMPAIVSTPMRVERLSGLYTIFISDFSVSIEGVRESLSKSTLHITDPNGKPVKGISAWLNFDYYLGETGVNGTIELGEISENPRLIQLKVDSNFAHNLRVYIDDEFIGISDEKGLIFIENFASLILDVKVIDSFSDGVENADVFIDNIHLGKTDANGEFHVSEIELALGEHVLRVECIREGYEVPLGSVVVEIDGNYYIANRWAPGYPFLLALFITVGLENYITIILASFSLVSLYLISRRFFNWKVAFISTVLFMTNGIAVLMLFSKTMADYASTAFAVIGMLLFIQSFNERWRKKFVILGIFSGMMFGIATAMRYSTVVVTIAPFFFILATMYKSKRKRWRIIIPTREAFVYSMKRAIPFLIGLAILGAMIANYNSALFGGPLNAGYSMEHSIEYETLNNTTVPKILTPTETLFEEQFGMGGFKKVMHNLPRIYSQLFLVFPILFLMPHAVWRGRKHSIILAFTLWALTIIIIYSSMYWVGQVPMEDMRYFLPAVPAVSVIVGYSIYSIFSNSSLRVSIAILIISLLIIANLASAAWGINYQLEREKGWAQPSALQEYKRVSISQLLSEPLAYNGKLVRVENAKVISMKFNFYSIKDSSSERSLTLHFESEKDRPELEVNATINVQGFFRVGKTNNPEIPDPEGEWEINIRANTKDRVEVVGGMI